MVKADTLPVLSEGDVSSVALLFADPSYLSWLISLVLHQAQKPDLSLSVKRIIIGKMTPLNFNFSHLQNVPAQQLLVSV